MKKEKENPNTKDAGVAYENSHVIVVLDRTTNPKGVVGCVSAIDFRNNEEGWNNVNFTIDPNPNNALHFNFAFSSMIMCHLCSSANREGEKYEITTVLFRDINELYNKMMAEKYPVAQQMIPTEPAKPARTRGRKKSSK